MTSGPNRPSGTPLPRGKGFPAITANVYFEAHPATEHISSIDIFFSIKVHGFPVKTEHKIKHPAIKLTIPET